MDAELNPAQRLHALGQSLWLDSISRVMLRTGALARYVRDLAVTGLTSNPTILGHAMAAGSDYDRSLARLAGDGVTDAQDLVYALALEDLTEAAALFRPQWEHTQGADGYVSLEVPPDLAYDAAATVALARRLHDQAGLPNLLVKIPGTPQGLTAMEEAITAGIGVNVTLLFSDTHYLRTADAYLRALERRRRAGLDLAVPSVASVFISRWDSAADPLLPSALHSSLGLAMAQKTYASHLHLLSDQRWQALAEAGARPQRVLWASTSTKNPDLPDTYYLGRLAAPNTIDTVPEKTLLAFADHGSLDDRLEPDYAAAERAIAAAADAGIDADALAEHLQRHGAGAFTADWAALLTAIKEKAAKLTQHARGKIDEGSSLTMSHHFDTAIAREDPRLNLLDFYLFRGQPGTTVMAMTVNPNAGTKAPDTFHQEGLYAFRFDVNDDAREEVTFKIRFGKAGHAEGPEGRRVQTLEVRRATGRDAAKGTAGEVIASGTTGRIVAGEAGVRIFAGLAPDLFAANLTGNVAFRAALAAGKFAPEVFRGGVNYFQDRNVTAIVMEVPAQLIGDRAATVCAWVTVSLCGHAPEVQVSRWGLPLMTHIFITDPVVKDAYNRSGPAADVPRFSQVVADALARVTQLAGSADDPAAYAQQVVERLFPATLPYVLDSAASFGFAGFNGRALTDNVENVMLSLQANTPIDQGAAVARTGILGEFPYFGAPHADPIID